MPAKTLLPATLALLGLALLAPPARAQEHPFQISLIGPTLQLVDAEADVKGLRLSLIYGKNVNVTGADLGLVSHVRGDLKGFQWGLVGLVDGRATGWQNGFANVAQGELYGLQSGFMNVMGRGEGVQWGGIYNSAQRLSGLQVALVNVAEDLHGIQVGLVNIIRSKARFPVLPLVNWKLD